MQAYERVGVSQSVDNQTLKSILEDVDRVPHITGHEENAGLAGEGLYPPDQILSTEDALHLVVVIDGRVEVARPLVAHPQTPLGDRLQTSESESGSGCKDRFVRRAGAIEMTLRQELASVVEVELQLGRNAGVNTRDQLFVGDLEYASEVFERIARGLAPTGFDRAHVGIGVGGFRQLSLCETALEPQPPQVPA